MQAPIDSLRDIASANEVESHWPLLAVISVVALANLYLCCRSEQLPDVALAKDY